MQLKQQCAAAVCQQRMHVTKKDMPPFLCMVSGFMTGAFLCFQPTKVPHRENRVRTAWMKLPKTRVLMR